MIIENLQKIILNQRQFALFTFIDTKKSGYPNKILGIP